MSKSVKELLSLLKSKVKKEGSRGGNIIGHTKSGDPVYEHSKVKNPKAPENPGTLHQVEFTYKVGEEVKSLKLNVNARSMDHAKEKLNEAAKLIEKQLGHALKIGKMGVKKVSHLMEGGIKKSQTQQFIDLLKGRKAAPVGTVSGKYKKVAKDKWVPLEKPKKMKNALSNKMGPPPPENREFLKPGRNVTLTDTTSFISKFEEDFKNLQSMGKKLKAYGSTHFASRLKDRKSLLGKMTGRLQDKNLDSVSDIIGSRSLSENLKDQEHVYESIKRDYEVVETKNYLKIQKPDGYRAIHLIIRTPSGKLAELQLKTYRQQVFAGYSHDFIYKGSEKIKNDPEVIKYVNDLSDYLYTLDKGAADIVSKRPVEPDILGKNDMEFQWDMIDEFGLEVMALTADMPIKFYAVKRDAKTKENLEVLEFNTFKEAKNYRENQVKAGHEGEIPLGYSKNMPEFLDTFTEYRPKNWKELYANSMKDLKKALAPKIAQLLEEKMLKKGGIGSGPPKSVFYFDSKIKNLDNKIRQAKKEQKDTKELEGIRHYYEGQKKLANDAAQSRIKVYPALYKAEILEALDIIKGGKRAVIGEQRTWSNGIYVKHADGWVKLGGPHHGKLMGQFKKEATHKEFADQNPEKKELSNEEKNKMAAELGKQAFLAGKTSTPIMNKDLMGLLAGNKVGEGKDILEAYTKAWHAANLNAPVEEPKKPYDTELTPSQIEAKKQREKEENLALRNDPEEIKKRLREIQEAREKKEKERLAKIWEEKKSLHQQLKELHGKEEVPQKTNEEVLKEKQELEKEINELSKQAAEARLNASTINREFGNLDPSSKEFKEISIRYAAASQEARDIYNKLEPLGKKYKAIKATAMSPEEYVTYERGGSKTRKNSSIYRIYAQDHFKFVQDMFAQGYPISQKVKNAYPGAFEKADPAQAERGLKTKSVHELYAADPKFNYKEPPTKGKPSRESYTPLPEDSSNLVGFTAFGKAKKDSEKILNKKLQYSGLVITKMGLKFKTPLDFVCSNVLITKTSGVMARYFGRHTHRNPVVDILSGVRQGKSLLHEIGHGVDYALTEESGNMFSETDSNNEKIVKMREIILESPHYGKPATQKHWTYLRRPTEVFARAFEIYSYKVAKDLVKEGKIKEEFLDGFVPDAMESVLSYEAQQKYIKENRSEAAIKLEEKLKALGAQENSVFTKFKNAQEAAGEAGNIGYFANTPEGKPLWDAYIQIRDKNWSKMAEIRKELQEEEAILANEFKKKNQFRQDAEEVVTQISSLMEGLLAENKIKKGVEFLEIDLIKAKNFKIHRIIQLLRRNK